MSTQSGITVSTELVDSFKKLSTHSRPSALIIKISSDSTQLNPTKTIESTSTPESLFEELNKYIATEFPEPSYIIIAEPKGSDEVEKSFISFIPDVAKLRSKMLYASTRNTILSSLGNSITYKVAFTELEELHWKHFLSCTENSSSDSAGLLTEDERILQELNNNHNDSLSNFHGYKKKLVSMNHNNSNIDNDILYKFDQDLDQALNQLSSNEDDKKLIVFNIDTAEELLKLQAIKVNTPLNQLISTLQSSSSQGSPSYSLYNYKLGKLAFIYSCPSGSPVKLRMIYASFKNSLINQLNSIFTSSGLAIEKNFEVGDLDELELSELEESLLEQEHGQDIESVSSSSASASTSKSGLKFNKPKGPRRR